PVIAFNRGAASELIADGVTGFLVDDVDAMARALEFLGEIQPERCRAHVESNFSAQALADNYLAVYEKILSEPGVPLDDAA
ncbi:MAG TPA: glycosyltransferase family 4 protein, partial [Dehalococcoidia bacterium]|nr:glycosyltransferase family 4 protein [Dehalococcoidia bacterium]